MPAPITPPARTEAEIEAELMAIDTSAREQLLDDDGTAGAAAATTPPAKPSAAPEHDYEYEARRKGWRPESEYSGPEGKWVDAKTFVERGERFTKKLENQIATLQAKVESFEGTKAQFRKFFDEQMTKRDREHADAIASLRIQRSQAIRDGDDALAIDLEDRIDLTKAQQKAFKDEADAIAAAEKATPPPAVEAASNPLLEEWVEDGNTWFKSDEILTKHALAVGDALRKAGDRTVGRAFLDKVAAQVRSDFPRRFKTLEQPAPRHSATEGAPQSGAGGAAMAGYNGKTERDLPLEDLAIMRQFVKEGLYTKEQFLKSYFSRNGN